MVVREVSHEELERLIDKYYFEDIAHFIAGATGIGKSFTVKKKARDISNKLNREFVEWNKLSKEEKHNVAQHPEKYFLFQLHQQ